MVETAIIADEIRKHIAEGMITDTALIAVVAHLADLFPDLTIAQVSAAMREAIADAPQWVIANDNRPAQDGMRQHFSAIADATEGQIRSTIFPIEHRSI
jgi:dihydrodipicolinate synthase/N-acetylneuraminate lyase